MNLKALVVLSGGQDSTTCLAWAKRYFQEVHAITFNYGQRHSLEIEAAANVCRLAGVVEHHVVDVGPLLHSTSPLVSSESLEQYEDYASMDKIIGDRVEKTFVPMRNAFFLTLAANRAVSLGIANLITGVCQADNANYPDCRRSFIVSQQNTINEALGTGQNFAIHTPLMDLDKKDSVLLMMKLDQLPLLAFTHTAYDGVYPPVGKDHASVLRAYGFEQAGVPDPLVLRAWDEGLMPLPGTDNYTHAGGLDFRHSLLLRIRDMAAALKG
jgi:7-cyano-7-deazaguanine synthase